MIFDNVLKVYTIFYFVNSNFSQSSVGQNYLLATALLAICFSAGQKCSAGQEMFCSQAAELQTKCQWDSVITV